jgi:eukaryotic-like serine/threonine-protein kinase
VRHGDLRPKHVLLRPGGVAVTGFGLLEALSAPGARSTAVTVGAPAYLSPEQLAGEGLAGGWSDLYSLGCVLYEMLTGEPPFGGPLQAVMVSRKLTQPPPSVRDVRASVPAAVERLLGRCLARLPADRPRSAAEVGEALAAALAQLRAPPGGRA